MKLLAKLEKTKIFWWITTLCVLFFFLRIPSLIEPYWYGDEGIYEVIGRALNHGELLYRDIWDNKPPFLYVTYALFDGNQSSVKFLSLIVGALSLILFYFLAQKVLNSQRASIITTFLFLILLGTPILEGNIANAENFTILPILIAGFLIYNLTSIHETKIKKEKTSSIFNLKIFVVGLLIGIAFLYKIVAIFDFAAFFLFFILSNLSPHFSLSLIRKAHKYRLWNKRLIFDLLSMILGFVLPLLFTILYFFSQHALHIFFQSVFSDNVSYVAWQNTFLGISQGLLILKFVILIVSLAIIVWKRKALSKPTLFIFLWLIFSLFNAFFSERPYTHYALVLLPSFCLLTGLLFIKQTNKKRAGIFIYIAVIASIVFVQFKPNISWSYRYYVNIISFLTGKESTEQYQIFFDPKVPRDYAVASFIKDNTSSSQQVFIWGNNPQIYILSDKIPPGKYTVAYHIIQNNAFRQTQQMLIQTKPKYVIVLKETQPLPFVLPLYIMRYNLAGTTIYERSI